jgi:hypothetical protein
MHDAHRRATRQAVSARAEKLSALSAMLGPGVLDRLMARETGFAGAGPEDGTPDPDRVSWQRNRLIRRLRARWAEEEMLTQPAVEHGAAMTDPLADPHPAQARPERARAPAAATMRMDARIVAAMTPERLADEHPAVVAHVLQRLERHERIAVLRRLPGKTARAAVRRLKPT